MLGMLTRRIFVSGLAAFTATGAVRAGAPKTSLRPLMRAGSGSVVGRKVVAKGGAEALIAAAGLQGDVACAVADVKTGLRLEAVQGNVGLPPASVSKALTTLYALDVLGPEYRFQTRLIAAGAVKNGVLHGDLILAGGGDPTLSTDSLAVMAGKLKKAGIREVRGGFRVFDGALPFVGSIDKEQPDHVGYSPAISGIALNHNRVYFQWKRGANGYGVTMDARTDKYRPEVAMASMRVAKRDSPVYTYADKQGRDQWSVAVSALGKGGSRWLPVRKPGAYAGDVFRTMARAHGIILRKPKVVSNLARGGQVLVTQQSVALKVILKGMLRFSNNLTAEMVGMTASAARGARPASLKASASEMSRWAARKYRMTGTKLVDHSGLGDASRMTVQDLVGALVQVRKTGILRPLLKPISMRDSGGRVLKGHPIKVNAKTGTLNFVSALAGFMTGKDGTEMAFAIFIADTKIRARIKRSDRERPQGARGWNKRSKQLQQKLIERWGALYGS
ncbi:MAG: D-alanyl-D-alanine carboxypeptidase/D-alanyl-D-alanine-endopeptidase [Rhodobacteraceae bacterium]|nr:D-alanyl-D-alanine carboxypeptidase/D-alanyl-D-alanine-endopeptidase [Paracoccaceae bacterium]